MSLPAESQPHPPSDLNGLSSADARARLAQYGSNAIREEKKTLFQRLLTYFWGPIP